MFGGRGLLRMSLTRVELEDRGVRLGDWFESREPDDGNAVPSLLSLFFLDLFGSLSFPRDSYGKKKHVSAEHKR